jgi:hypothetical protein
LIGGGFDFLEVSHGLMGVEFVYFGDPGGVFVFVALLEELG